MRHECSKKRLKSVQQIVLSRRHAEEIEQDVQDTLSMWIGTSVHDGLEEVLKDDPDWMTETRPEMPIDGFTLSGEFDLLDLKHNVLYDYKTCKVAQVDKQRTLSDDKWLRQLYIYADLIEHALNRPRPEKGIIVAMTTDHSKVKAETQAGYPKHPIQMVEWDLCDESYAEKVRESVRLTLESAQRCLDDPDAPIPACSMQDCWCTEDWAAMKEGATKATKRFSSEVDARAYIAAHPELRLYHRISDFMKCRHYCECAPFCDQWKENMFLDCVKEDVTDEPFIPF